MLTKDSAVCLRAVDYSETSQVVTLFTKASGKISAIAKGSKRLKSSFDGPIEVLSYGRVVFSPAGDRKLATLTEFDTPPGPGPAANNLFALNCSYLTAELVNDLTNECDPHPELFDQLLQFLRNTQEAKEKTDLLGLLILFQLALLKEIGLQPVLNICANCKSGFKQDWPQVYFSSLAKGLVCRDCEANFADKIRLSKPVAGCLADLKKIAEADEKTLEGIEKILIDHFTELLRHRPKMAKYIL